ncbi:hypothetical protein B1B_13868 [mine drainage metagenome]|uniref:Uncharacterized protein n=2 Tax=mine drainage metagenome TaxID=410659 RepID=T0ZE64_9ZZZZ
MPVLTREHLIRALGKTYGTKGMPQGDIEELSDFILSFFGYEDYVLDNVLSSAERDVFYNLEEYDFLEPYREEVTIVKGKVWRVNQWKFKRDKIAKVISSNDEAAGEVDVYEEIFREISDYSKE